jgi:hypothetical protein
MDTNTAARMTARYTTYVSVMPRNSRIGDSVTIGTRVLATPGMTYRSLPGSAIMYVFTELPADEARVAVAAIVGNLGRLIETLPAADGARRVTIDPALIA